MSLIPYASVNTGAAPTDAEAGDWYRRNVARYTVPERRVMRYIVVDAATVKARAAPRPTPRCSSNMPPTAASTPRARPATSRW
ncbi:hypothetical protein AB5I41_16010 [Sphingomonas sp. MMS24-JH45]